MRTRANIMRNTSQKHNWKGEFCKNGKRGKRKYQRRKTEENMEIFF
jgi:hypothetical protein